MASISRRFPPELIDRIIDHLHEDVSTLLSCSTVSRTWLPAVRFHLVHSIFLSNDSALLSFLRFILRDPNVGQHARYLHFGYDSGDDGYPVSWLRPTVELGLLPSYLLRLKKLELDDDWSRYGDANRRVFIQGFQSIVALNISSSTFYAMEDALELLLSFPMLDDLSLCWIDIGETFFNGDCPSIHLSKLRVLASDLRQAVVWRNLAPYLSSPMFTSLHVPLGSGFDLAVGLRLCTQSSNILTELRFDIYQVRPFHGACHAKLLGVNNYSIYDTRHRSDISWGELILPMLPRLKALTIGRIELDTDVTSRAFVRSLENIITRRPFTTPSLGRATFSFGLESPIARTVFFWTPIIRAIKATGSGHCTLNLVMRDTKSARRTRRFVEAAEPTLVRDGLVNITSSRNGSW
jgi:hypothetical protein